MHLTLLKRQATSATGAIPIVGAASCAQSTPKPTSKQLKTLFVASAVPMIGFGFMDNFIMIQAGSYIDSTLGVSLGLATLTAAAMGQVFSDVSGVVFGGTLERFLHKFKMIRSPGLTEAQRHLTSSRNVAMAGSVVGVIVGCMLGACSLLFLDLEAHERARRAEALYNVVTCMLSDSPDSSIECDACTVYLASAAKDVSPYSTRRDGEAQLKVLQDCNEDSLAVQSGRKRAILKESYSPDGTYLYVPVVKGDELIAVLEFHRNGDESTFTFDEERTAIMMARHMAIFIDNLACD
jgi:hypothetical protein